VVQDHRRRGLSHGELVEDERRQQTAVENADASGDGKQVGQIAQLVADDER
jgi:hypothetical protein